MQNKPNFFILKLYENLGFFFLKYSVGLTHTFIEQIFYIYICFQQGSLEKC